MLEAEKFSAVSLGLGLIAGVWILLLQWRLRNRRKVEHALITQNADLEKRMESRTNELQKMQGELKQALEQERELSELKSRFVTMVSHEFRTPLGIIMSAIELMRHYDEKLPSEQKVELQEDIHEATRQMAGLMEQVLVLGRVEAGRLSCRAVPLELELLLGKIIDESLSATNRKCEILLEVERPMTGARADESLLRHVFGNLISNAVKYSPEHSTIIVKASRRGSDAIIVVEDQGIGIPEEDQPRLYDAFFRCGNVGEIPGTGLGLLIVRRCVELHGGNLQLRSTVGLGTTFTVTLPLFAADQATAPSV